MKIEKAQWTTDGDTVRLNMPLQKVDQEKRLVSGFATLDNADTQGDIVEADASTKAFARFRGNIREMHQPIAVGKLIDFREDTYFDPKTDKFYSGIYATAYVSKGAQATWEKVLDGTLTGFSIGGNILDSSTEFDKSAGRNVRFVKDYELVELSLVDSPANQLANVFSIQKAADGVTEVSGYVSQMAVQAVFWCNDCGIAIASTETDPDCPNCGGDMEEVGWFELDDNDDPAIRAQKVRDIVNAKFTPEINKVIVSEEESNATEGGVSVAEEVQNEEVVEEVTPVEEGGSEEAVEETPAAEETEKAADVSEVEVEEPDFEKMLSEALSKNSDEFAKAVESVKAEFEKFSASVSDQISELSAKHGELSEKFNSVSSQLSGVEKRIDGVEGETAVKKSSDLGGSTGESMAKANDSKWGGAFFSADSL